MKPQNSKSETWRQARYLLCKEPELRLPRKKVLLFRACGVRFGFCFFFEASSCSQETAIVEKRACSEYGCPCLWLIAAIAPMARKEFEGTNFFSKIDSATEAGHVLKLLGYEGSSRNNRVEGAEARTSKMCGHPLVGS